MAKPKKSESELGTETTAPVVELNHKSFSLFKNPTTGMWIVARIDFDADTQTVGKLEILSEDLDRGSAQERFKIAVAQTLL